MVSGGRALARLADGRVVFVAYAAPGELVDIEVERVHSDYLEAVVTKVVKASTDRIEPRCGLFGECGGCQLQHMSYEAQLKAKETIVREQLERIGGLDSGVVRPIAGATEVWGYRNHLRLSTGKMYGDVGFVHRRGRGLLKVEECPVADPWSNDLLSALQGKGAGPHQIQIRRDPSTGRFLIAPEIAELEVESGQDNYVQTLTGREFQVSVPSFFQVNHPQAERMVGLIAEALPERARLMVDAFAGVGTFAVAFADRFERVIAIEDAPSAVRDAEVNIRSTPNVDIRKGRVEGLLPALAAPPDVILLDPPRAGCQPEVLEAINRFRPETVVYVSCNPSTLARDLRVLVEGGYALQSVTPVDMFPQTGHIECVSALKLAGPGGD
jgi:23S rRNA (uracil1939-C5)-methyltransferase